MSSSSTPHSSNSPAFSSVPSVIRLGDLLGPDANDNFPYPSEITWRFAPEIMIIYGVEPLPSFPATPQPYYTSNDNASIYSEPSTLDLNAPGPSTLIVNPPSARFSLLDYDEISTAEDSSTADSTYALRRVRRHQHDNDDANNHNEDDVAAAARQRLPISPTEERAFQYLASLNEEVRNRPDQPQPASRAEARQRMAEERSLFERLPLPLRNHLSAIADKSETRLLSGAVREKALCGSRMWVQRETGRVPFRPIDWSSSTNDQQQQQQQSVLPKTERAQRDEADRLSWCTEGDHEADMWFGMEDLGPVYSGSVPSRLRERALRSRRKTIFGSMTQAIRGLFGQGSRSSDYSEENENKDNKRFSLKEFLARSWRKRGSHDSALCMDGANQPRDPRWDRVGPMNEQLVYSAEYLPITSQ